MNKTNLICPKCGGTLTPHKTVKKKMVIHRYRKCTRCGITWKTEQHYGEEEMIVRAAQTRDDYIAGAKTHRKPKKKNENLYSFAMSLQYPVVKPKVKLNLKQKEQTDKAVHIDITGYESDLDTIARNMNNIIGGQDNEKGSGNS